MVREDDGAHTVPHDLRRLFAQQSASFRERFTRLAPDALAFGQLWTVRAPTEDEASAESETVSGGAGSPRMVLILAEGTLDASNAHALIVLPLSTELFARSSRDFVIYERESPLGYPFMVEAWHEMTLLPSQLGRYLGELSAELGWGLGTLYRSGYDLQARAERLTGRVGTPIWSDDDPRAAFQRRELDSWAPVQIPALRLLSEHQPTLEVLAGQGLAAAPMAPIEDNELSLAPALDAYRRSERLDEQGLAAALGCSPATLDALRTSRKPRGDPAHFRREIEEIAAQFGVHDGLLAEIVRRIDALEGLRRAIPMAEQGLLMAARDRREVTGADQADAPMIEEPEGDAQ